MMRSLLSIILLFVLLCGCTRRNYSQMEPTDPVFSGSWIVYSKDGDKPFLIAAYKDGRKDGKLVSYRDFPAVETEMNFRDGVLDGPCMRYDLYPERKLVEGVFKDGKPWNGEFLIGGGGQVLESPFFPGPTQPDISWHVARYKEGARISVREIGPH